MVAADTTRTISYLEHLIKYNLIPSYILLLLNKNNKLLPGQKNSANENEIIILLEDSGIQYEIASNTDINNDEVIRIIANREEKVFIYSGYGGVLLKDKIIESGKKFLHMHGGFLPDFKGSTANYYSLIMDNTIGASAIFINKEIDCGPILCRRKFSPPKKRTEIDHSSDSEVRAKILIECLMNYVNSGTWGYELKNNLGGETFYIIHPVLKHLAILGKRALR